MGDRIVALTVDAEALAGRFKSLPIKHFAPGESVLAAGTATGLLLVLEEGTAEVVKDGVQIGELTEPGLVLGELSALLDAPHTADVRAVTACSFRVGDAAQILRNEPVAALWVATIMARRLDATNRALAEIRQQVTEGKPRSAISRALERLLQPLREDSQVHATYMMPYF